MYATCSKREKRGQSESGRLVRDARFCFLPYPIIKMIREMLVIIIYIIMFYRFTAPSTNFNHHTDTGHIFQ